MQYSPLPHHSPPLNQKFSYLFVSKIYLVSHKKQLNNIICNFHICAVRTAIVKIFNQQLMHKRIVFKAALKFTLKLQ